ncbi:alpha-N-arabinofuranosidase [Candidatus Latescibacterota bacterium]
MNQRAMVLAALMVFVSVLFTGRASGQVMATVDATETGVAINPFIYGKFTELLGNYFEKGLWAELVSDRTFFYPVDSSEELVPVNRKRNFNRWWPVGPDECIVMDNERPYVGEHDPVVKLEPGAVHGIQQEGISLRKGKEYTGRVVLAGDTDTPVSVSLVWGSGNSDSQTIIVNTLSNKYANIPLRFTSGGDTEDGRIEITGMGTGSFRVAAVSLMPADNVNGYRKDIIEHLKRLDSGTFYRWPGGNQVSQYDWREGIGDPDRRPPHYDLAWFVVEYNDVGTDEFMTLCELLELEPFMVVNAGLHDEYSAAAWVEYCNGAPDTPMGKLRAANGHPEPYNVKLWGVGNEMYAEWQWGHLPAWQFVEKHNLFVKAMRKVDPTITIVASGATPFETSMTGMNHRPGGSGSTTLPPLHSDDHRPYEYGSERDWTGNLLAHCLDNLDIIAEHFYPRIQSFDIEQQHRVDVDDPPAYQIRKVANRVRCVYEAWQEYLKRMPHIADRNITFALDEWAGLGGHMMRALCVAETLHEMFRYSDLISMSGYTGMISCISHNAYETTFNPLGLVYLMYKEHFGTIPVDVGGNSPQPQVSGTVGVDKPAVPSGSPTYPLDVSAALTSDRRSLTVAVVNPTESEQEIDISFTGASPSGSARLWRISGDNYDVRNEPGENPVVEIEESQIREVPSRLTVPPISVTIYEFAVR